MKIIFSLLFSFSLFAQQEMITVIGEQLIGKYENGESIREVIGNVVLTQGNVIINCDRAIQYLAKNDAKLIGNVVIRQDTLTIYTQQGYYFGNSRRAVSTSGVRLEDTKVILTATKGEYFFNDSRAEFDFNVKLWDSTVTLNSQHLIYYRPEAKAIAFTEVSIKDSANIIYSDSLIHFRDEKLSYCFRNVRINSLKDNVVISGNYLEDHRSKNYTLIEDDPMLLQIDTVKSVETDSITSVDTLIIRAKKMEAFRGEETKFIASDSVIIWQGVFASRNELTHYNKGEEKIITYKNDEFKEQPVMWYENSQLSGDSINIQLIEKKIEKIYVLGNALVTSFNVEFPARLDQISGGEVQMSFEENNLTLTEVFQNILSVYYLYEEEKPNGLIKASARDARINFLNKKVEEVRLFGEPNSEYHPENLVKGNEKNFLLPRFKIFPPKPKKLELLLLKKYKD